MKILISFCNTFKKSKYYQSRGISQLAILDTASSRVFFVGIPDNINANGITGICLDENYVYYTTQSKTKPRIVKLRRDNFAVSAESFLKKSKDPHSILIWKDSILVVSTGTSSIEEYSKRNLGYLGTYWQHPNTKRGKDKVHVNSISVKDDETYVSCMGVRKSRLWNSAKKGYVMRISDNKIIHDVYHPHSLFCYGGSLYYCGSGTGTVFKESKVLVRVDGSYVRGLAINRENTFIGLSAARKVSRSSRILINVPRNENLISKTGVLVLDQSLKRVAYYDLSHYFKEIYDLVLLDDTMHKVLDSMWGISSLKSSRAEQDNPLVTRLLRDLHSRDEYINYLRSSHFFKYFSYFRQIEKKLLKK